METIPPLNITDELTDSHTASDQHHRIVMIGAGNLATHLTESLLSAGHNIIQVYSRSQNSAQALAHKFDLEYTTQVDEIALNADLYVIAIKDKAIEPFLESATRLHNKFLVHTSGSVPMAVLATYTPNCGVLYPLQAFSKTRRVNFELIPICVEANTANNAEWLMDLANQISTNVQIMSSEQRQMVHLAAVFASNFVNHMYALAYNILNTNNIEPEILTSIIQDTANRILGSDPLTLQTGPAARNDQPVIKQHIELLEQWPELANIYKLMTNSIIQTSITRKNSD